MPQVINGQGTRSYLICINSQCNKRPIGVLKSRGRGQSHETQLPYCEDDLAFAQKFARTQLRSIDFISDTREWLKKRQEEELKAEVEKVGEQWMEKAKNDEIQSRARRRSEG